MEEKNLTKELSELLNRHSREGASDTPDFILANYLTRCLEAFESATRLRDQWYEPVPSGAPVRFF